MFGHRTKKTLVDTLMALLAVALVIGQARAESDVLSGGTGGGYQALLLTGNYPKVLKVRVTDVPVTSMELNAPGQTYVQVTVEPAEASGLDHAYRYFNMFVEGEGVYAWVNFDVDSGWLAGNGLDATDVKLFHQEDGSWVPLETGFLAQDDVASFRAFVPGFSMFGIGVIDEPEPATEPAPQEAAPEAPAGPPSDTPAPGELPEGVIPLSGPAGLAADYARFLPLGLFALAVGTYLWKRNSS
jgi:PGF-pre-PGF domain-containing protein